MFSETESALIYQARQNNANHLAEYNSLMADRNALARANRAQAEDISELRFEYQKTAFWGNAFKRLAYRLAEALGEENPEHPMMQVLEDKFWPGGNLGRNIRQWEFDALCEIGNQMQNNQIPLEEIDNYAN